MSHPPDPAAFEQLLEHLRQTRGFDFTAYKRPSLMRRIAKRMQEVEMPTFDQYLDYLQVHQDEFASLFNTILINVTSFFRDGEVWERLRSEVLPPLLEDCQNGEPLRVWSAGCASGQEAYSMAMLLAQRLGVDRLCDRVKIHATDVDDTALTEARHATYSERQVADVPADLLAKYFDGNGGRYRVKRDLRRAVIFGRHDLLQDAPISRIDLLLCRNTLMYFNADAQARVLAKFFFSANPEGLLVLGRAEMMFSHSAIFEPVDLKRRVFRPVATSSQRDGLTNLGRTGDAMGDISDQLRLRDAAFEAGVLPQLVIDNAGVVAAINAAARSHLGVAARDVGRPLSDLEISYRPAELRGALDRVAEERREVTLKDVRWSSGGDVRYYEIALLPLFDCDRTLIGTRISFTDVTSLKAVQEELQQSRQELETAYEELQSTNEELETTNEELQSTVEELETTNEELQSTNEELETMNEELQSTNAELQTINDELRNRSGELNSAHSFLEAVFASLRSAVVVVDREYRVQVWNSRSQELWGLRRDEAYQTHFLSLDIGLPVAELGPAIHQVLAGGPDQTEMTVPATNRRGRRIDCHVTITPLHHHDGTVSGAILLIDEKQVTV